MFKAISRVFNATATVIEKTSNVVIAGLDTAEASALTGKTIAQIKLDVTMNEVIADAKKDLAEAGVTAETYVSAAEAQGQDTKSLLFR